MLDCQSVIGLLMLDQENPSSKDKSNTFRRRSHGLETTISRSLSICTVRPVVRMGTWQSKSFLGKTMLRERSFDNSGQRLSFPGWHSNQTNIQRTNAIIQKIAGMFNSNTNVVSVIAPLNEYVPFSPSEEPELKRSLLDLLVLQEGKKDPRRPFFPPT